MSASENNYSIHGRDANFRNDSSKYDSSINEDTLYESLKVKIAFMSHTND